MPTSVWIKNFHINHIKCNTDSIERFIWVVFQESVLHNLEIENT